MNCGNGVSVTIIRNTWRFSTKNMSRIGKSVGAWEETGVALEPDEL
jgi:hypothetical protein